MHVLIIDSIERRKHRVEYTCNDRLLLLLKQKLVNEKNPNVIKIAYLVFVVFKTFCLVFAFYSIKAIECLLGS